MHKSCNSWIVRRWKVSKPVADSLAADSASRLNTQTTERSKMPNLEWDKVTTFIQTVGIPFACLLLFIGPFMWLALKYGPKIVDAHVAFLTSATETQKQNSDTQAKNAQTLEKLEETASRDQESHYTTHHAIGLVAEAGLAILDENHNAARSKLQRVELVLNSKKT